jgi:hypothetical protein
LFVNNYFNYFYLHKSSVEEKVVLGKEGWLFRNNSALPAKAVDIVFSENEMDSLKYEIYQRLKYYKSKGIDYYLFIVPNKATIYNEYVSERYSLPKGMAYKTKTERFMEYIAGDSLSGSVYYLKGMLMDKKDEYQLYYKKDHHWNRYGALFATDYINEQLRTNYPAIKNTAQLSNYKSYTLTKHNGNLANTLGLQDFLTDEIVYLDAGQGIKVYKKGKKRGYKPTKGFAYPSSYEKCTLVENDSLPKAVVIRDSFTNQMIPFLSNSFSEAVYIWDGWHYGWNKDVVEKEKPDIVINIVIEQHIGNLLKFSDLKHR